MVVHRRDISDGPTENGRKAAYPASCACDSLISANHTFDVMPACTGPLGLSISGFLSDPIENILKSVGQVLQVGGRVSRGS